MTIEIDTEPFQTGFRAGARFVLKHVVLDDEVPDLVKQRLRTLITKTLSDQQRKLESFRTET